MTPKYYACELYWGWGGRHSFHESYRFSIYDTSELDPTLKSIMTKLVDRYAFDCGRLNSPLHPHFGSVRVTPVYDDSEYVYLSEKYDSFVEQLVELKRLKLSEPCAVSAPTIYSIREQTWQQNLVKEK